MTISITVRKTLANGAAVLGQTSVPIGGVNTNSVIAGHRGWNGYPYFLNLDELQIGDLVFFGNTYSSSAAATHVGIYVGDSQFIHSASGGVKITALSDDYYAPRYVGARRIL